MSHQNNNNNNKKRSSIDALITSKGRSLAPGQAVSIRLVKGPNGSVTADPVDPKAPAQPFPLLAKFPESVMKPNFETEPWSRGRFYQQDIPKPADDSDNEDPSSQQPKKRWKFAKRKQQQTERQWILQEEVDFLETMVARRERRTIDPNRLSSRYEGVSEHNPSRYALFYQRGDHIEIQMLPATTETTVIFAQPASRKTLSLSEAEQAIEDQRAGIRTFHNVGEQQPLLQSSSSQPLQSSSSQQPQQPQNTAPMLLRMAMNKNKKNSKSRLLDKLQKIASATEGDIDDADDVMGDVAFRKRSGASAIGAARKELLTTLGDDGVTVSEEGVLGGTNDAAFGGRQRFNQFHVAESKKKKGDSAAGAAVKEERGADGAAMADDFYQRDVQAEYEELDYDANEQFDDDDVDLGEREVINDREGFGDEDEEDEYEELEMDEEAVSGAEGLATVAGFKALLAKARGEVPAQPAGTDNAEEASKLNGLDKVMAREDRKRAASPAMDKSDFGDDHMAKIMAAADKSAQKAQAKEGGGAGTALPTTEAGITAKPSAAVSGIQVDENGLRIITLEAVRREIWLNHGSIPMKRLMKIFDVKKKSSAERQDKFREVVKELCTMRSDPVGGRMLVLKQHYSNM